MQWWNHFTRVLNVRYWIRRLSAVKHKLPWKYWIIWKSTIIKKASFISWIYDPFWIWNSSYLRNPQTLLFFCPVLCWHSITFLHTRCPKIWVWSTVYLRHIHEITALYFFHFYAVLLNTLSYLFVPFISDTCLLSIILYNQNLCVHFFILTPVKKNIIFKNKEIILTYKIHQLTLYLYFLLHASNKKLQINHLLI